MNIKSVNSKLSSQSHWATLFLAASLGCLAGCQPEKSISGSSTHGEASSSTVDTAASTRQETGRNSDPSQESSRNSPDQSSDSGPGVLTSTRVISLFDGKSLDGWEVTRFGGQGETRVEDGAIQLEPGFPLTGLHSSRTDLPKANYEILVEARKVDGIDFFCGLTFPVNESHCSLIVGGWAGTVVGLSNIDDQDASENETRKSMKFESGQWYSIRLRVEVERIQCWIDNERVIDQITKGRKISLRNESLPSRPLGVCSFETKAEIRTFEIHLLEGLNSTPKGDKD